jgi:hypothetical protein
LEINDKIVILIYKVGVCMACSSCGENQTPVRCSNCNHTYCYMCANPRSKGCPRCGKTGA